jgi:hypothetical protein
MDDAPDRGYSRAPEIEDLTRLCRRLNQENVRYLLIGGFAVILHGFVRTTKDIDLLIDPSASNVQALRRALATLPDNAVADVADDDIRRYQVVRVADEIVVDLMAAACGISYDDAIADAEAAEIDGVEFPVASKATLIRMKQTSRPSDLADRQFLQSRLDAERGG